MNKILVICPSRIDKRELLSLSKILPYHFVFDSFSGEYLEKYLKKEEAGQSIDILETLSDLMQSYSNVPLAGIISSDDYPGSILASLIAKKFNLVGPDPKAVLHCQHKYYCRQAQKKWAPEVVPQFALVKRNGKGNLKPPFPFPLFLKPIKSYFSCFASQINSEEEWSIATRAPPLKSFVKPFNQLLMEYTDLKEDAADLLAEELLEGKQVTLEGYVYENKVAFLGIVDSVMYPNTISFKSFIYPSELPKKIQDRMKSAAEKCMGGLKFNNGLFNIEFIYNQQKDTVSIIEINPRISSQFADLYEKVDGTNSYEILVSIATGNSPLPKQRKGFFKYAASCVLRAFEDKLVKAVPSSRSIEKVRNLFPETRIEIFAEPGQCLSAGLQDGKSFRYCVIDLGGQTIRELEEKLEICKEILQFEMEGV